MNWKEIIKLGGISSIAISTLLLWSSYIGDLYYRNDIENICNKVNYHSPEKVKSYEVFDINNDGQQDIILNLRDGSKLEYLSKGYDLKE